MSDLSAEVLRARERVDAGMCPFCDAGPYRSIAMHVTATHGMYAAELRDYLEYPTTESICDPELSERHRPHGKLLANHPKHGEGCHETTRRRTKSQQALMRRMREKAYTSEALAKRGQTHSQRVRAKTKDRDDEILRLVDQGVSRKETAARLGVCVQTVYTALRHYGRS